MNIIQLYIWITTICFISILLFLEITYILLERKLPQKKRSTFKEFIEQNFIYTITSFFASLLISIPLTIGFLTLTEIIKTTTKKNVLLGITILGGITITITTLLGIKYALYKLFINKKKVKKNDNKRRTRKTHTMAQTKKRNH